MEKWKSDYLIGQISKLKSLNKKYESAVVVSVILNEANLEIRPDLQQYVRRKPSEKRAYIDLYYPDIKLAIEIDEKHHDDRQEEDAQRQEEIINELGCEFLRINARVDQFNVGDAIKTVNDKIVEKLKEYKDSGKFVPWPELPTKKLSEIQSETTATIIIKTVIDENGAEVLPYNMISDEVRKNAKTVIAYSGSGEYNDSLVGYLAFNAESFMINPNDSRFVSPTGSTITACTYLNTYIDKWDGTKSVVYSNDLLQLVRKGKHNPQKKKRGKKKKRK